MTTPLIILGLLIGPWLAIALAQLIVPIDPKRLSSAGVLGIVLVFCFTGVGHFVKAESMALMLPSFMPAKIPLVYATGLLEIGLALGLLSKGIRKTIAFALVVMLLLFLPVNIWAAINYVAMGGHRWGPIYLLIRVPLQATIAYWIWMFAIRKRVSKWEAVGVK